MERLSLWRTLAGVRASARLLVCALGIPTKVFSLVRGYRLGVSIRCVEREPRGLHSHARSRRVHLGLYSSVDMSPARRALRLALKTAAVGALLLGVAQAQSEEPECPTISLDDVSVLTAPCADASRACDLDVGCMGAVIDYVGTRIDLSQFSQGPPSQEYIASCVAPFALSPEVTETVPQETLGAMINCDFDAVAAKFEEEFAPEPSAA